MEVTGEIKFTLLSQTDTEVTAEMPVQKGILNPFGIVHAGAMLWFADVAASVLVIGKTMPTEGMQGFPLAINLNANFTGNNKTGTFLAKSEFIKKGKTVSVVRTQVTDIDGKIIADVTTNHVLSS
ncbi:PaaI family thioesterase [Saccharophagus degradans]|uniref:PaaI family thioesterase n=1 Tax=Saccharophagus degradans TaxID=86304 RepID=UPI001C0892E9|nr:PaaI family thioesterase [Saccharophagus degradans]MBU2986728.1 PaaI family thioesterase [Saccharophagus degradans]